jgi:glycosyltransferase involved in cell wall biosynthesis
MPTPTVTVIIPTFNRARYISEAVGSVLRQTFTDFEVVVVDDGSTDCTAQLVGAIRDPRVRYLHRSHRGISAAINAGIGAARGGYIARLDSDDRWLSDLLTTLVDVLEAQPKVGVAYGKAQIIDSEGRRLPHTQGMRERFPGDTLRSLMYEDCTCNIALVVRRQCFDQVGLYDETLVANEDWDMWLRVARHYAFQFVDQVMAEVRWHDDSLTGLMSPQLAAVLDARTVPLDKLFRDPDLPPAVRAMQSIAYTNVYLHRGRRWLQARHLRRAGREFGLALRTSNEPWATVIRIVWLAAVAPALQCYSLGRRLLSWLAERRHERRAQTVSRQTSDH